MSYQFLLILTVERKSSLRIYMVSANPKRLQTRTVKSRINRKDQLNDRECDNLYCVYRIIWNSKRLIKVLGMNTNTKEELIALTTGTVFPTKWGRKRSPFQTLTNSPGQNNRNRTQWETLKHIKEKWIAFNVESRCRRTKLKGSYRPDLLCLPIILRIELSLRRLQHYKQELHKRTHQRCSLSPTTFRKNAADTKSEWFSYLTRQLLSPRKSNRPKMCRLTNHFLRTKSLPGWNHTWTAIQPCIDVRPHDNVTPIGSYQIDMFMEWFFYWKIVLKLISPKITSVL